MAVPLPLPLATLTLMAQRSEKAAQSPLKAVTKTRTTSPTSTVMTSNTLTREGVLIVPTVVPVAEVPVDGVAEVDVDADLADLVGNL